MAAAHRRSAQAIEAWAHYVEALPEDDPNLALIAAGQAVIGSPSPNDTLMRELARLEGPPGSVDEAAYTT